MTTTNESLASLRLPELQARFAEVIGEPTRSPNKKYLIRRITEALASQSAVQDDGATAEDEPATTHIEPTPAEPEAAASMPEATAADDDDTQSADEDVTAPADDDTERSADEDVTAPADDDVVTPDTDGDAAPPADDNSQPAEAGKPLRELTVSELQRRYLDVVGRPTGSSHRGYLIWKIREAQKGRIPVGPRTRRSPNEPAPDYKILPLRMDAELVERLDDARERLGLPSRMDLFRKALSAYLSAEGEHDLAEALVPGA